MVFSRLVMKEIARDYRGLWQYGLLKDGDYGVDPPLNVLSLNLKDSHVLSGSFLYIKMKEKN